MSSFATLAAIDVGQHMEKKGKFTYLSWSWAVDILRKNCPDATWEVMRFDGFPYLKTELGFFVEVAVTVSGIKLSQVHPVLDNNNSPLAKPNCFQINTSIQRCLVKAIALHGLGLYIYAGEDLPGAVEQEQAAAVTNNSGATEPTTMYAYQWWKDTTAGIWKQRNAANTAWLTQEREQISPGPIDAVKVAAMVKAAISLVDADGMGEGGMAASKIAAVAILAELSNDEKVMLKDMLTAKRGGVGDRQSYAGLLKKHLNWKPEIGEDHGV